MSMKNSNDTIGNRTRDLPACSAVPQPTAPPRAPSAIYTHYYYCCWKTQMIKWECILLCTRCVTKLNTARKKWRTAVWRSLTLTNFTNESKIRTQFPTHMACVFQFYSTYMSGIENGLPRILRLHTLQWKSQWRHHNAVIRQAHSLFQSQFPTVCDLVLPLSFPIF